MKENNITLTELTKGKKERFPSNKMLRYFTYISINSEIDVSNMEKLEEDSKEATLKNTLLNKIVGKV